MTLKPLRQHNNECWERWWEQTSSRLNGLACPTCGNELWDEMPGQCLPTSPPQYRVTCRCCGYFGTRL